MLHDVMVKLGSVVNSNVIVMWNIEEDGNKSHLIELYDVPIIWGNREIAFVFYRQTLWPTFKITFPF